MLFDGEEPEYETYPVELYIEFLEYIKRKYKNQYWQVMPQELAGFWKENLVELNG